MRTYHVHNPELLPKAVSVNNNGKKVIYFAGENTYKCNHENTEKIENVVKYLLGNSGFIKKMSVEARKAVKGKLKWIMNKRK